MLASAYVERAWYRRTPALVLDPAWRVPALVQYAANVGADLFCLQEVEPLTFAALRTFLGERGYGVEYSRKLARCPDGVAICYRCDQFELLGMEAVGYRDSGSGPDSGYIMQVALMRYGGSVLGVINTHLTWDAPETAPGARRGLRQARELLREQRERAPAARGWLVCGDFNVTPESEIVALMADAGFHYAHRGLDVRTCNVGARARLIDYLFHSRELAAEPIMPAAIDDKTVLPSPEEPSDHVALTAAFDWQD